MKKQVAETLRDLEYYLSEAQYLLQGERQLGVQSTAGVRENLNRAANRLQSIKECIGDNHEQDSR